MAPRWAVTPVGRFAPSPSGSLHLGNLRTALIAWLVTRQRNGRFVLRMEDLTTGRRASTESEQIRDLELLGIDFDGELVRQSDRIESYVEYLDDLTHRGLTYECFCSRREIRDAGVAPHRPVGSYPGTCRDLDSDTIRRRTQDLAELGRRPALRLRADATTVTFRDRVHGEVTAEVDDFVLRRGDGLVAYNLAVVVDDAAVGVDHVVRGDDLVDSTPRQILLQRLLGLPTPEYIHVPLVLGPDHSRLSKRHGSVGLIEQIAAGATPGSVRAWMARTLGIATTAVTIEMEDLTGSFDIDRLPRAPVILDPGDLRW